MICIHPLILRLLKAFVGTDEVYQPSVFFVFFLADFSIKMSSGNKLYKTNAIRKFSKERVFFVCSSHSHAIGST